MGWLSLLTKGKKVAGAVKSVSPHVGSLKKTRAVQDDMIKSIDQGRKIKGKEKVKEILMAQPHGKKLHDIVKKAGDVHHSIHKRNVGSKKMFRQASGKK